MNEPPSPSRPRRKLPAWLSLAARVAATGGLMAYALRDVKWSRLAAELRDGDWRWLVAGLAISVAVQIVAGARWAALAQPLGFDFSRRFFIRRFFEGVFFSLCLPSSIGGDVVKAYRLGDSTPRRLLAACSVLADRLTGVSALGVLAGAALVGQKYGLSSADTLLVGCGMLVAVLLGFWIGVASIDRVMNLIPSPSPIREFIAQLLPYQQRPALIARAVGWSLVVQVGGTIAVALMARTVRVDLPLSVWFAVAPLVALIETLPISIGGFGLRENAMEFLLAGHGVASEKAIAVALLCGLARVVAGLIGGGFFLIDRGSTPLPAGD